MADTVTEAQAAYAAAVHDPASTAKTLSSEAALPAVRALNGAGAPALLPAMHRIVNAVRPGLIGPEAALYGYWMEWHRSNRSGRPLSMGDTLRLTGEGSATSLHSSAPALLHALRTRCPMDAALYLDQAGATYPGGVSELDGALQLLHPPDEDLEVGEVTILVAGTGETPTRPRPTNPVYDGARPTPPYAVMCEAFPREPTWCPALQPATHAPRGWADPRLSPPPLQDQGCSPQSAGPLARMPGHPSAPPRRHNPRGPGARPGGHPHPPVWGSARAPPPPPGARDAGWGAHLPANTGCHLRYGGPACAAPPGISRRPPEPQGPEPHPGLGAVARRVSRLAHPPPAPVPVDGRRPLTTRNQHHHQPPPPPPHSTTQHCPRHTTDALGGSGTGTPTTTYAYQGNSDVGLRWLPPGRTATTTGVSPGCVGESLAEHEERQLAEAGVLVGPPAGQPQAAPSDPGPPAQDPVPAWEAVPAAQAAASAAPPPEEAADAKGAATAAPAGRAAAPSTPPARQTGPMRAPSASLGAATAAAVGREVAKYRAHTKPSHTHRSPLKLYRPKAAFPEGRLWPVRPPSAQAYDAGPHAAASAAAARHQARDPRGGRRRTGGAECRPRERGARGGRRRGEGQGTDAGDGPERTRHGEGARTRARHQGQWQRGRTGTRSGPERGQQTEGQKAQRRARARAREGHRHEQQRPGTDGKTRAGCQGQQQRGTRGRPGRGQRAGTQPWTWARARASAEQARVWLTEVGTRDTGQSAGGKECARPRD